MNKCLVSWPPVGPQDVKCNMMKMKLCYPCHAATAGSPALSSWEGFASHMLNKFLKLLTQLIQLFWGRGRCRCRCRGRDRGRGKG